MSMTDEIKKVVAEGVEDESVTEEEISEVTDEVVEEEVEVAEAKVKEEEEDEKDSDEDDEEEVDESSEEDDEEDEDEVEEVAIPKTKAGVINAALEMLKKARKDEAQQLFAKMVKQVSEDDGQKKAVKSESTEHEVKDVDFGEDLDLIVSEEATLSDGFRDKAGAIFEAAYKSKVSAEIDRLESEYAQNLESEVNDLNESLVNKVDSYLNYVVENWVKENEVAIESGLRTEIAEQFMDSLQSVFKEHYIEVPEGKADLIDDLADQVAELEEQLNKTTEENIRLYESTQSLERAEIVRRHSSGLAETEAEKLSSLVEDIEFDNAESFEMKVSVVKESYFKQDVTESVDEVNAAIGNQEADEVQSISNSMAAYTQAITKSIK